MAESSVSVVILAAGKATRFKSEHSKMLHRLAGRPLGEYALRTAMALHPAETLMVIGYEAAEVRKTFQRPGVTFIEQKEQLGTGHALMVARPELERSPAPTLLVVVGDAPLLQPETLRKMLEAHAKARAAATVLTTRLEDPAGYGRIVRAGSRVRAIVEEKVATPAQKKIREINSGILCFNLAKLLAHLDKLSAENAQKEFLLTNLIEIFYRHREKVAAFPVADSREVLGVNDRWEFAEMEKFFRLSKAQELARDGVTVISPEATYIDEDVEVGRDTVIEPGVSLLGRTRVGRGCLLRPYSTIADSIFGDRVTVRPCSVITGCEIASDVIIGPFAHLRDGAVIEPDARIGNFVEVKKSRVGRGSKAWHLTYLGDAELGQHVNIGAGTVTCNYDGVKKNPTTIEDGCFIGSGSMLVAPVRVGKSSTVGAGSTITEDVPPESLAIARAQQVVKEGWVRQRGEAKATGAAVPEVASLRRAGEVAVFDVTGRLTMGRPTNEFAQKVRQAVQAGQNKILLNLNGLVYIDSSGIGAIMAAAAAVQSAGGQLKMASVPPKVMRLLEVANLNKVVDFHEDEGAALKSFA